MRRSLLKFLAPFAATIIVLVIVAVLAGGHKPSPTRTAAQQPSPTTTQPQPAQTQTTPGSGNFLGGGGGSSTGTVIGKVPPLPKATPKKPKNNPNDPQDYNPQLAYQIKQTEDEHHFVQKLPYQDSQVQINFGPDGTNGSVVQLQVIYSGSQAAAQRHVDQLLRADHDSPSSYSIIWEP